MRDGLAVDPAEGSGNLARIAGRRAWQQCTGAGTSDSRPGFPPFGGPQRSAAGSRVNLPQLPFSGMSDRRVLLLTAALAVGSLLVGAWLASRATRVADERGAQFEVARDTAFGDAGSRADLQAALDSLVREAAGGQGRVEVALRDIRTRAELGAAWPDADGPGVFPMAGVYAVPVAVAILGADAMGNLALEDTVAFKGTPGARVTIDNLLELAVSRGDDAARETLVAIAGGADSVSKRLELLEVQGVSGDHAEPAGVAAMFARLAAGSLLPPPHTERLLELMNPAAAGTAAPQGLSAGVPQGTPVWNITGTGVRPDGVAGSFNDVAILERPDGRRVVIALFIAHSEVSSDRLAELAASVARVTLGG